VCVSVLGGTIICTTMYNGGVYKKKKKDKEKREKRHDRLKRFIDVWKEPSFLHYRGGGVVIKYNIINKIFFNGLIQVFGNA